MLCLELIWTFCFDLDAINIFQWQNNSYIMHCFLLGKCYFENSSVNLTFFPDKVGNQVTDSVFCLVRSCSALRAALLQCLLPDVHQSVFSQVQSFVGWLCVTQLVVWCDSSHQEVTKNHSKRVSSVTYLVD